MNLIFNTYEELSDFCYPFEKNLGNREWSDDEKHQLLNQITFFYRQKLDEIAEQLSSKYTLLAHLTMDAKYWGRCWYNERIIELNPNLICYPPLLLTETIIHELTHYQQVAHGKQFYTLMEQNVHKLGLQHVLYGWQTKPVRYPTSIYDITQLVKKETLKDIEKFFRISYTSKSKWKPIPNGASMVLPNDWTTFTTPAHVNIPKIQGILSRAELVWYAERTFRNFIESVAPYFSFDLDGYTVSVSNRCWFDLQKRSIDLPVWLIGMQPDMRDRFIVTMLTRMDGSDKYFRKRLDRYLHLLGLDLAPAPTDHCLFQIFKPWETSLFDENGKPKIRYEGNT